VNKKIIAASWYIGTNLCVVVQIGALANGWFIIWASLQETALFIAAERESPKLTEGDMAAFEIKISNSESYSQLTRPYNAQIGHAP